MSAVCPDCEATLTTGELLCSACGWKGCHRDRVEVWFGKHDYSDPVLQQYFANYDRVAADDLDGGILDSRYVANQARNMARYVGRIDGLDVCDVGCGQGLLTRQLAKGSARSLTVVDISMAYLNRFDDLPEVRLVQANAENLPFREAFDLVVTTDVMEHVLNLGSFLLSLNRALRPGGRAYVRVPLRENLLAYSPHLGCRYSFVHLRSFNRSSLRECLVGAGFEIEKSWTDGFILGRPQAFWQRGLHRQRVYNSFQKWIAAHLADPADVTTWPAWFAQLFMPPLEIVVQAQKTGRIERVGEVGFRIVGPER